jgi:hypothetical protein
VALVTVAELKSVLGVGNLYADADLEQVADAASAVVTAYLTSNTYPVTHYSRDGLGYGYAYSNQPHGLIKGQSVTISGVTTGWNGTHTITDYGTNWIQFALVGAEQLKASVVPSGLLVGPTSVNYDTVDAVKEAALTIAVDMWQNRLAPGGNPQAVDFTPSPYRMGRTLMQRVIGLLAPYLDSRSIVG